ncbi:MAG: polysaccharide pyruvyl transferase family protein [Synergistaceae bacterium]|nr:polysaccharide pyruvyl transferase family protein [Synergistaceae bacterium]
MTRKIAVLTITHNSPLRMNYGNRLQNYALQQTLIKLGHQVMTVDYKSVYPPREHKITTVHKRTFFERLRSLTAEKVIRKLRDKILRIRNKAAYKHKLNSFDNFIRTNISWTEKKYSIDSDFSGLDSEFDYIIAGSDQIWNPYWEGTQPVYFMEFVPENKRITYAASFGVSGVQDIPENMREYYKRVLTNIPFISCREDSGCGIVEALTGKKALHVLDPVFLLEPNEWSLLEKKPSGVYIAKRYILVYFLGSIPDEAVQKIKSLKSQGFSIIYLDRADKFNSCFASPEEFLYLISHAQAILTDSFHGCAFSIIYNRPFTYFNREIYLEDMSSRFDSLFKMLSCSRYANEVVHENEILSMNYDSVNASIAKYKAVSLKFLKSAVDR